MKTADKPRRSTSAVPRRPEAGSTLLVRSPKITATRLEKLAIVYVRQSSPQQVLENRESTARQYALADHAQSLGWPAERVLVIDEDQGQSGRSAEHRSGFQRLLAEVTMDHVGLVLGLEMSRLARSSKDWHHLLELCAVFGTLLADQDGVYDPSDPNDRLLLGLKGTMSEVELHTMRNRLDRGRLNKAQRGELFCCVPLGYILLPTGEVAFDPDEQARSVVHLLFEKFVELGSLRALFRWLVHHGISLPIRPRGGPNQGRLQWRRPSQATLRQVLHHPMYAGAYVYGRRPVDPKRPYATGKHRRQLWRPMDQWQVLIPDRLPAYITWERYLKNQERLKQNQLSPSTLGPVREGCALLCGLLVCGQCGWRMQVSYRKRDTPHYRCTRHLVYATKRSSCFGLSANVLDELVSRQVLLALEPAALELSLKAQADLHREHERLERHWKQNLQRARYEVDIAERRYQAVDPENRLVAATLERQWEEALRQERELREEYDRCCRQSVGPLSAEDEARIAALASNLPALWRCPQTTNADRQAIVRCLVEKVVVHVEQNSEYAAATIHWAGGHESRIEFVRPVRTYDQVRDFEQLLERIVALRKAGKTATGIAKILNAEGFSPRKRSCSFNRQIIANLLQRRSLGDERRDATILGAHEWWLSDLARELKMSRLTLHEWTVRGWLHGRRSPVQGMWILWADTEEINRLRKLRGTRPRGVFGYPSELTTPKTRKSPCS